ncbi:hypothetical protein Droror1_Dr00020547, partial [Drosera rotundifolia]
HTSPTRPQLSPLAASPLITVRCESPSVSRRAFHHAHLSLLSPPSLRSSSPLSFEVNNPRMCNPERRTFLEDYGWTKIALVKSSKLMLIK